jgi:hypothetical protein
VRWLYQRNSTEATFLHWTGAGLVSEHLPTDVVLSDLEIVDGRWWIPADHGAVYVRQGAPAPLVAAIEPAREPFEAMWGAGDRDLYFVGPGLITHFDGDTWAPAPIAGIHTVHGVSGVRVGATDDEVWAVGSSPGAQSGQTVGDVFHLAGGTWQKTQLGTSALNAVWASGPGEAIAVGDGGAVYRHTGGAWTPIPSPVGADMYGVWGPDPDRAWIVGAAGTILRWERAAPGVLVPEVSPTAVDLRAIHGAGGKRWIATWGLGPDAQIAVLESSDAGWIRRPVDGLLDCTGVFATSATDVRFVGPNNAGRVFRYNGTGFVEERTGYAGVFSTVFRPPGGSLWVAGPNALLQHVP